jgi:hypothetical protein
MDLGASAAGRWGMKTAMRIFFVVVPAILFGLIGALVDYAIGTHYLVTTFCFIFLFGLGWEVTTPRRERGES